MTKSKNGKHIGAPTKADLDDPAVQDALLDRIAAGRGIKQVCRDDDMPDDTTVFRRMHRDESFADRIARARQAQQDAEVEAMREIADAATPEDWQVARLRVWTRQWIAARLAPKKFGLTTKHEHGGVEGGFPMGIRIESLSDSQLEQLVNRLQRRIDDLTPEGEL